MKANINTKGLKRKGKKGKGGEGERKGMDGEEAMKVEKCKCVRGSR